MKDLNAKKEEIRDEEVAENTPANEEVAENTPTNETKEPSANDISILDPSKFKRVDISKKLFRWKDNAEQHLKLVGVIHDSKTPDTDGNFKRLMDVINMHTGEEGQIVVTAVLASILVENYPNDGHIGRMFEIKQYKREGKRYRDYTVTELQLLE